MQEFEKAYQQYFDHVYRFLMRLCGNAHMADDLTQETFLHAILNKATYREQGHMLTWLCTIAKNLWISECRKKKYETEPETDLPTPSPSPEEVLWSKERRHALHQALLELPEDYRSVILLHIYADVPLKEIAYQRGKSESWGKVTFYRAKQQLTKRLEEMR